MALCSVKYTEVCQYLCRSTTSSANGFLKGEDFATQYVSLGVSKSLAKFEPHRLRRRVKLVLKKETRAQQVHKLLTLFGLH